MAVNCSPLSTSRRCSSWLRSFEVNSTKPGIATLNARSGASLPTRGRAAARASRKYRMSEC